MLNRIEYRACPLCQSAGIVKHATAPITPEKLKPGLPDETSMEWMRCAACDHVFVQGYLTPEAEDKIVNGEQPDQQIVLNRYETMRCI